MDTTLRHSVAKFGHRLERVPHKKENLWRYTTDLYLYEYWQGRYKKVASKTVELPVGESPPSSLDVLKEIQAEMTENATIISADLSPVATVRVGKPEHTSGNI